MNLRSQKWAWFGGLYLLSVVALGLATLLVRALLSLFR
jgi:hypothetical protein